MLTAAIYALAGAASLAAAVPLGRNTVQLDRRDANGDYTTSYNIQGCDAQQQQFIEAGFDDLATLAKNAKARLHTYGKDDFYQTYFGDSPITPVLGFYDTVLYADKTNVTFRCDNPDGNCEQTTAAGPWAGHWRGENATQETVLCPPTFSNRSRIDTVCDPSLVGPTTPLVQWLALDLLHRLSHIPSLFHEDIEHFADSFDGLIGLASEEASQTVYNLASLQFFALDAYARDVASPTDGCRDSYAAEAVEHWSEEMEHDHDEEEHDHGEEEHDHGDEDEHDHGDETSASAEGAEATATSSAEESCHTHADGIVHC